MASLIRVVLPLPLGPKRPTMRPGSMAKVTPSKAVVAPKRLTRPLLSRMLTLFLSFRLHKGEDLLQLEAQLEHPL